MVRNIAVAWKSHGLSQILVMLNNLERTEISLFSKYRSKQVLLCLESLLEQSVGAVDRCSGNGRCLIRKFELSDCSSSLLLVGNYYVQR